jgi:penicillin amidase
VTVERDAQGVPTVRGSSRLDVARVTGFLHAQDRYFQMDLLRRQAAGELSALVGPGALDIDRRQRLHRMRDLAGRTLNGLSANERALIAAYSDGVNEGLARLTVRPPEYLLLRASPQPWRPEDTVLAVHAMFFRSADAPAGTRRAARRPRLRAGTGRGVPRRQRRGVGGPRRWRHAGGIAPAGATN